MTGARVRASCARRVLTRGNERWSALRARFESTTTGPDSPRPGRRPRCRRPARPRVRHGSGGQVATTVRARGAATRQFLESDRDAPSTSPSCCTHRWRTPSGLVGVSAGPAAGRVAGRSRGPHADDAEPAGPVPDPAYPRRRSGRAGRDARHRCRATDVPRRRSRRRTARSDWRRRPTGRLAFRPGRRDVEQVTAGERLLDGPRRSCSFSAGTAEAECKPGVVAEGTEVAEVVLARSESSASARSQSAARPAPRPCVRGLAVGPGIRDARIAGYARRQPGAPRGSHLGEAPSMPLCTYPRRSSSRRTFSPTTEKRKCPGSMMPGGLADRDLVHAVASTRRTHIVTGPSVAGGMCSSRSGNASAGQAAWRSHGRVSGSVCAKARHVEDGALAGSPPEDVSEPGT